jgi:hypothetical protein
MAKADPKAKAKGKKDAAKGKKGKSGDGPVLSVARHPKAGPSVRRAKGWGGLAGFVVTAALSYAANVPAFEIGLRALAVGIAGYLVAWACSVTVWRVLLVAELRVLHDQLYPPVVEPSVVTEGSASQATDPSGPDAT